MTYGASAGSGPDSRGGRSRHPKKAHLPGHRADEGKEASDARRGSRWEDVDSVSEKPGSGAEKQPGNETDFLMETISGLPPRCPREETGLESRLSLKLELENCYWEVSQRETP